MSELLNSYTFEAKKIVYYSVTVGANNKTEARRIASNFEHCQHYEEVEYIEGDLINTEDENGNEILEDITEYEAHKIYQQMIRLTGGF